MTTPFDICDVCGEGHMEIKLVPKDIVKYTAIALANPVDHILTWSLPDEYRDLIWLAYTHYGLIKYAEGERLLKTKTRMENVQPRKLENPMWFKAVKCAVVPPKALYTALLERVELRVQQILKWEVSIATREHPSVPDISDILKLVDMESALTAAEKHANTRWFPSWKPVLFSEVRRKVIGLQRHPGRCRCLSCTTVNETDFPEICWD